MKAITESFQKGGQARTSHFCFHFLIIPNPLTCKMCANYSGSKLVWAVRRVGEKCLKFGVRCSHGPHNCKRGQFHVANWTRTAKEMYINEKRTFKACKMIALLNMLICYVLCLVVFLLAVLSLSLSIREITLERWREMSNLTRWISVKLGAVTDKLK